MNAAGVFPFKSQRLSHGLLPAFEEFLRRHKSYEKSYSFVLIINQLQTICFCVPWCSMILGQYLPCDM